MSSASSFPESAQSAGPESAAVADAAGELGLVPAPRSVRLGPGRFRLPSDASLDAGLGTEGVARWLRSDMTPATGLPLLPAEPADLTLRIDPDMATEGYRLVVDRAGVRLTGGSAAGVFRCAQTLRQLFGPDAFRRAPAAGDQPNWELPEVTIEDAPRFGWRGFMLDTARHFLPKDGVLRYLDLLAAHKLNVFHFHLTDDQGWRIEIKRYPRLTEVSSWRRRSRYGHRNSPLWTEQPHGGYYTQEDIREIVAYAAERHITVVPEIEMPGHARAAIAAYPELGNSDVVDTTQTEVWDDWGITEHVVAPTETTLRFYENVLTEVLELFPGEMVHVGGDECPRTQWEQSPAARQRMADEGLATTDELQAWIIRHFDRWLAERGRRLIGWDEILEGGLAEGATVSSWRGYAGGIAAAEAGHDVVMCPEQQVYFDHRQAEGEEPFPIGYVRTLHDVYRFEPVPPQLAGTPQERHVLGAQANLWTEVVHDRRRLDYQAFPRLSAFAEVVWSALPEPDRRDLAGFDRRMAAHYPRLDALGVAYRPPGGPYPWQQAVGPDGTAAALGRPLEGPPPSA